MNFDAKARDLLSEIPSDEDGRRPEPLIAEVSAALREAHEAGQRAPKPRHRWKKIDRDKCIEQCRDCGLIRTPLREPGERAGRVSVKLQWTLPGGEILVQQQTPMLCVKP